MIDYERLKGSLEPLPMTKTEGETHKEWVTDYLEKG